jgi:hypothetical protein
VSLELIAMSMTVTTTITSITVMKGAHANGSNTVHRHEPPITNDSILVLHIDRAREFIVVSKPGSIVSCSLSLSLLRLSGPQGQGTRSSQ